MGVKYVKDFMFPSAGGFHGSNKMPSKARASERGMPAKAVRKADGGMMPQAPMDPLRDRFSPAEKEVVYRAEPVRDDGLRLPPRTRLEDARFRAAAAKERAIASRQKAEATKAAMAAKYSTPEAASRFAAAQARGKAKRAALAAARRGQPTPVRATTPVPEEPMYFKNGGQAKIGKVMREYKEGKLHSGSKKGPKVKNPKQAMAIALSEARKAGAKIPKKAEGGPLSYAESGSAGGSNVTFKEAFKAAREKGLKEFSWKGDKYSTKLKEETKSESKVEEKAPKAEAARKGPESRGGKRNVSEKSEVKRERKMELPSDRGSGFRSQAEETGMSASERAEKARGYAENLMNVAGAGALLRAPAKAAAKSLMRKGMEVVGGRKLKKQAAEEAARKATPEYKEKAAQMEKFAEQMRARQKMGARYEEGGYASKGPSTRGTARKGREQGRKDRMERWAEQRMRHAEKYAPGLSLDMKKHGGMPVHRRKPMYGGGKC